MDTTFRAGADKRESRDQVDTPIAIAIRTSEPCISFASHAPSFCALSLWVESFHAFLALSNSPLSSERYTKQPPPLPLSNHSQLSSDFAPLPSRLPLSLSLCKHGWGEKMQGGSSCRGGI